jgi:hypothetical protein
MSSDPARHKHLDGLTALVKVNRNETVVNPVFNASKPPSIPAL